ncbi:MAG: Hpt domain-containing protein [Gammaproteobacteria bacterium]|nr:Hpt domain-containing protein [Gammaproteobacteria bacterium]
MPEISKHIDEEVIEELREIMEEDFVELVSTYVSDSREGIKRLDAAFNTVSHENIRNTAHTLKGSSANLGAMPLSSFCAELEDLAKEERTAEAENLIERIKQEFSSVSSILNAFI